MTVINVSTLSRLVAEPTKAHGFLLRADRNLRLPDCINLGKPYRAPWIMMKRSVARHADGFSIPLTERRDTYNSPMGHPVTTHSSDEEFRPRK